MTPYQKRVITLICRNPVTDSEPGRLLDFWRGPNGSHLQGVPRREIIEYAHNSTGIAKWKLNTYMDEKESVGV